MAARTQSPFSPLTFEGANQFLGTRDGRKIKNNTYLQRRGDDAIAVMLHSTDVVTYERNGRVTIKTGGWSTNTTRDRINGFSPVGVSRMNFEDYVNGKVWDGHDLCVVGHTDKRRGMKNRA